jgi:hypothetical protein
VTDPKTKIADTVAELTQPHTHLQAYLHDPPNAKQGRSKQKRIHPSQHLSLLDQLRACAYDRAQTETEAADREARTVPHPDEDAMDRLDTIRRAVGMWLLELGITPRAPKIAAIINRMAADLTHLFGDRRLVPWEIIRAADLLERGAGVVVFQFDLDLPALVGATGGLARDTLNRLAADVTRWRDWCLIMAGWVTPPRRLRAPCPHCGQTLGEGAGLRLRLSRIVRGDQEWGPAAVCLSCDMTWEGQSQMAILAEQIERNAEKPLSDVELAALVDPAKRSQTANRGGRS